MKRRLVVVVIVLLCSVNRAYSADAAYCGILDKNNAGRRWIDSISREQGPVIYKVYKHDGIACESCHHQNKSNEYECGTCHKGHELQSAFHRTCRGCHDRGKKGPTECAGCHEPVRAQASSRTYESSNRYPAIPRMEPSSVVISGIAKSKGPVRFQHKNHSRLVKACKDCHHKDEAGNERSCGKCHDENKAVGKIIELKEAFHKDCKGCHQKEKRGPTKCDGCHQHK